MNTWKNLALVLTGILIGCGAGAGAQAFAQNFPANPAAPKWQQFCEAQGSWPEGLNRRMASHGAEGWEIAAIFGDRIACYKRPAP